MAAVSKTFSRKRIDILAGGTKQGELANQTKNNDNRIIFWETSKFALNLQIVILGSMAFGMFSWLRAFGDGVVQ